MKKLEEGNLYFRHDLAKALQVDSSTINRWIAMGILPVPTIKWGARKAYSEKAYLQAIKKIKETI